MEGETRSRLKRIYVSYGNSSRRKGSYEEVSIGLSKEPVERRIKLVYGGGRVGLMALFPQEVLADECHVLGVTPVTIMPREIEVITWVQFKIHHKIVSLLNVEGIIHINIDGHEQKSILGKDMLRELQNNIEAISTYVAANVLMMCSLVFRMFFSSVDLKESLTVDVSIVRAIVNSSRLTFSVLEELQSPSIAVIEGTVVLEIWLAAIAGVKHQMKWKAYLNYTKSGYSRCAKIFQVDKYRKGACEYCGAITHTMMTSMERPQKLGAKWTSKNIAPDEKVETFDLDYVGKRDMWNGSYAHIFQRYESRDEAWKKY
ncbi:hypothetical protein L1987_48242 [Smallanthus sonchifolius]|uniref:Uncharacterized protein n=1 Tax=Smallanthus sonchifolius TaxID=185202 RepID=A0ACB9FT23_9ASTR|nr:hypothetical protein L1987_48242 [Smallanthus sonchifolius]